MSTFYHLVLLGVCQIMTLSTAKTLRTSRSILFESADISVSIKTVSGERLVEAFNATTGVFDPQLMRWVSLGVPRLLSKANLTNSTRGPFEFVTGGFYIYVETLGAEVANELARYASLKYKTRIEPSQFLPVNKHLWSFGCSFKLIDEQKRRLESINGSAVDLSNPATIFFETGSTARFERALRQEDDPIIIQCTVESYSYRKEGKAAESDQSQVEPAFVDKFSVSTKAIRIAAFLEDNLEKAKQAFVDSVMAGIEERLRDFNQSLDRFTNVENSNAQRFACTFGLIDANASSLVEANVSACVGFAKEARNYSFCNFKM